MTAEEFYNAVAELLQCEEHVYKLFPYLKRDRWNNRAAGNGRYPGFGLVRMFSPNLVVVTLTRPALRGQYGSPDLALAAIREALAA